jgi:hypothetical protein
MQAAYEPAVIGVPSEFSLQYPPSRAELAIAM